MNPPRPRPSFEARPVFEGLPRTKIHTPGFMLSSGAALLLAGCSMLVVSPPAGELSPFVLKAFRAGGWASLLLGLGLWLGAAASWKRREARKAAAGSPDAWKLDHRWTPGLARDHAVAGAFEAAFWMLLSLAVTAFGFYGIHLGARDGAFVVLGGGLMTALTGAACGYLSFGALRRGALFGESRLTWAGDGPLRAGSDWAGEIELADRVSTPYAHLQFIKERRIKTSDGVEYRRREHDRVEVACRVERDPPGRKVLRLTTRIPQNAPSTHLSGSPARYWELHVADDASGWSTTFLVPLYS